ncbi:hypothetical protein B1757_08830 [Acidithiobacillus marinus]|uniref:Ferrous iron transporter FeoA-like domain-containing protein n=1 Tax=Acidithiobacillus marinus TaxID=187490 RepID=A0A2I1DLB4_9PROT|nr:ferrous iron transport protein A [Acidithiobacillus marinus]PKY10672.1 hypothetical protein B1757_08830 [Acidithiobacillus marinus]
MPTPASPTSSCRLDQLSSAHPAQITQITGDRAQQQRLKMLGIRPGVALKIVHGPNKRGVVVQIQGGRFAIGKSLAQEIIVKEITI